VRTAPYLPEQLFFAHHTAGALDQVMEHLRRARLERDCVIASPQALRDRIESKRAEGKIPTRRNTNLGRPTHETKRSK
jgi:hypothetical protein